MEGSRNLPNCPTGPDRSRWDVYALSGLVSNCERDDVPDVSNTETNKVISRFQGNLSAQKNLSASDDSLSEAAKAKVGLAVNFIPFEL